ncbi:ANTAR domain-containing response regulator [Thiomonas sp.]|jgi:response regulator NasT|uniref:ANTAR domain-containing response regulator n=1 Tax=Thiomonas sp. TaxID=2047785 RepID=UPI00260E5F7A|nr:ANTAR domain-containing protein [Thiomonas sp.]
MSRSASDIRKPTVAVVMHDPAREPGHAPAAAGPVARGALLVQGLQDAGYEVVALLPADADLDARIVDLQPDLLIVDAESGVRDLVEHVALATRDTPRPIVLFTDDDDPDTARLAVDAGVAAYIVDGLKPSRVKPVIEVALARFARERELRAQLDQARQQLSERKTIERAKGLVMKRLHVGEEEAYSRMRRQAMEKGLKLGEIAQRILDAADLL